VIEPDTARALWHRLEAINAVAYFSPEPLEAASDLGLVGFWMGYVACRAAPLGAVGPGVVEATFANFHPARIRRAVPDCWTRARPADIVARRAEAAADAIRRLVGAGEAERLAADVGGPLAASIADADPLGRPLFAANADVAPPPDPVARLWQQATTLREHRGDAHVALLLDAGLDGCACHVLVAATEGLPADLFLASRGWSADDWSGAVDRLAGRGLVTGDGRATTAGRALRAATEQRTDELAATAFRRFDESAVAVLVDRLSSAARATAGDLRFPNPMGLPPPDDAR